MQSKIVQHKKLWDQWPTFDVEVKVTKAATNRVKEPEQTVVTEKVKASVDGAA